MSKTIIIAENGAAKTLTVDKLRTAGGGLFIPAEEALVDGITIRANGTYKASDFGLKAFDSVKVAVGSGNTALDGNARVGAIKAVTPVIREGNRPRSMGGTRYIKTRVPGGGACVWLPESAITTTTLTANRNGAYSPGDLYGYSQVTVNIGSGGGGGWGGGDISWGGGGDIPPWVESGEVDHIKITTPPSFLGPYLDGVLIQTDGIEVTAFDENDNALGVLPFEELVFPVTVTDFDAVSTGYSVSSGATASRANWSQPIDVYTWLEMRWVEKGEEHYKRLVGQHIVAKDFSSKTKSAYFVSPTPGTIGGYIYDDNVTYVNHTNEFTFNDKTIYWAASPDNGVAWYSIPTTYTTPINRRSSSPNQYTLWTAVYGDVVSSAGQVVPVQWTRPTDGEVLEDFFTISVDDLRPGGQGDDTPAYEQIPGILDIVF